LPYENEVLDWFRELDALRPVRDIRGILKHRGFSFERAHEEGHNIATFRRSARKRKSK